MNDTDVVTQRKSPPGTGGFPTHLKASQLNSFGSFNATMSVRDYWICFTKNSCFKKHDVRQRYDRKLQTYCENCKMVRTRCAHTIGLRLSSA